MMIDIQNSLRTRVQTLLQNGTISVFIGWGEGRLAAKTQPKFIFNPARAEELIYNENCYNMLAKYTVGRLNKDGVIGLATRGCEGRAIKRLLADNCLTRDKVYLLGIPCTGMKEQGNLTETCALCINRNPLIYDEMLALPTADKVKEEEQRFAAVKELEDLSAGQRYQFWQQQFAKCLRCYACRNACPACNCLNCYARQPNLNWQGKRAAAEENLLFGLTRAFHIGDRCVECGECQRACPMGLPLMLLNRKLVKDVAELFGGEDAALGTYNKEDLDEFM